MALTTAVVGVVSSGDDLKNGSEPRPRKLASQMARPSQVEQEQDHTQEPTPLRPFGRKPSQIKARKRGSHPRHQEGNERV